MRRGFPSAPNEGPIVVLSSPSPIEIGWCRFRSLYCKLPALPAADIDRAAAFARQDKAPATRAVYSDDFAAFQSF